MFSYGSESGINGGGSPSSVSSERRFTMVLPSVIEDSGDSGFSHLYLPCASVLRLHQCSEGAHEYEEEKWVSSPNDTQGYHVRESSMIRSRLGSPLRSVKGFSSSRVGSGGIVGGESSIVNPEFTGLFFSPGTEEGDGSVHVGLSKPRLSPQMIRFATPSEHLPEMSISFCMAPGCSTAFNFFHRRYRCKMCGRLFCFACCSNRITVSSTSTPPAIGNGGTVGNVKQGGGLSNSNFFSAGKQGVGVSERGVGDGLGENSPSLSQQEGNPTSSTSSACQVCRQCYYETHLVISKRQENGELRRRCRGEFKLFQRSLLLNIFTFLTQQDLAEVSLVSSDFYFISRHNVIWYQYNMQRWIKEEKSPLKQAISPSVATWQAKQSSGASSIPFKVAPMLQDAASVSRNAEAAKRVISLHARYDYTQFLDYARRLEMAQRDGLSSFMLGMRILFSSVVRIAITGPSQVGKTAAIRAFLGEDMSKVVVLPTVGFTRYIKQVHLRGAVRTQVTLHLYDISGAARYEVLRRFICSNAHAIGICYNPMCKRTLVEAADMMMSMEESLGPQPVAVCGLIPANASIPNSSLTILDPSTQLSSPPTLPVISHEAATESISDRSSECASKPTTHIPGRPSNEVTQLEVTPAEAKSITVRGLRSMHCSMMDTSAFFREILQCLLDRIALATMEKKGEQHNLADESEAVHTRNTETSNPPTSAKSRSMTKRPKADQAVARGLLNMTMQCSPLDILLDP